MKRTLFRGTPIAADEYYGDSYGNNISVNVAKPSTYTIDYSFNIATSTVTYNLTEQVTDYYIVKEGEPWTVQGKMNLAFGNTYTGVVENWAGKCFAVAPNTALNDDFTTIGEWNKVLRPKNDGGNYVVYFDNYQDEVETKADNGLNDYVWKVADTNDGAISLVIADGNSFTINCSAEATITEVGYATYSVSGPCVVDGATAYIVTEKGGVYMMKPIESGKTIPANTGIILKGDEGKYNVTVSKTDDADVSDNLLIGTGGITNYVITGKYDADNAYTPYIFANGNNGVGFYLIQDFNGEQTIGAHKAFLAVPATNPARGFIGFDELDATTGISSIEDAQAGSEVIYNLSGQRIVKATKGLYIQNGKKYIVK